MKISDERLDTTQQCAQCPGQKAIACEPGETCGSGIDGRTAMSYKKIGPGHTEWQLLLAGKDSGRWVCDAVSHNSYRGCPNPSCWKHQPNRLKRKPR